MKEGTAATVVLASKGYPDSYETGKEISIESELEELDDVMLFHAGTSFDGEKLATSGGRVLSVTAVAPTLRESIDLAYNAVGYVEFEGVYYRRDIGAKALS